MENSNCTFHIVENITKCTPIVETISVTSTEKFKRVLRGGSRVLERSSTGMSGKFQWCFSFKGVSRKFPRSCNEVSSVFQGWLKGILKEFSMVSRVFERNSKGISMKFQMCFKKDGMVFQWTFKWVSRSSMGVLGKFQRCLKDVSRKF